MGKKILVVDDEPQVIKVIEARLKANGYEVITAADGAQGLQKIKESKPDLIILDILMPGVDGTDMSQTLKLDAETKDIPIIFLTCLIDKNEASDIDHRIGDNLFLAKPFDARELLSMVDNVFQK